MCAEGSHVRKKTSTSNRSPNEIASTNEPFQYRTAILGILIGTAILVLIFQQAGMSVGILLAFLCLYVLMSIAITYARAAVGVPYHEVIWTHPQLMFVSVLGVRRIGASNLTLLSFFIPVCSRQRFAPDAEPVRRVQNCKYYARARLSQKKDGDCDESSRYWLPRLFRFGRICT